MEHPPIVGDITDEVLALFVQAQERIIAEQAKILALPEDQRKRHAAYRRRLRDMEAAIEQEVKQLLGGFQQWAEGRIPVVYEEGARTAARVALESGVAFGEFTWTQIHVDAVTELAQDTFADVLEATQFVEEDTKRWIREMGRRNTAGSIIEGRTAEQAARDLAKHGAKRLGKMGDPLPITSVIYKNGSLRTLDDYADMLIRTKTAQSFNAGTLNYSTEYGVTRFEIFDGSDCGLVAHDDPQKANGLIVDAKTAAQYPISHPRCRRAFGPRPDLDDGTPTAEPVFNPSTTAAQRADQAAAEQDRSRRLRRQRTARNARRARAERRARTPRTG